MSVCIENIEKWILQSPWICLELFAFAKITPWTVLQNIVGNILGILQFVE